MLNQIVLVGRIAKIEAKEENTIMTIGVPRAFKNTNGEYGIDMLPIQLFGEVGEMTVEYCKEGELVGVKGRLQAKDNQIVIIGEKITFLTIKNTRKEEE